jgi:hypothetical protein
MVDYAIVLVPDIETEDIILGKLRESGHKSINHTRAECVRFKPITACIETKRPGADGDGANVQLGVWAAEHFKRLRMWCGPGVELPLLPEVLIQGHDWKLKIASVTKSGSVVCLPLHDMTRLFCLPSRLQVVHGDWALGETRNKLGVFKLLCAIRVLSGWAINDYQPWFLKHVLEVADDA